VTAPSRIRFGDCELDLDGFELRRGGQPQSIEPQVFELLSYFARNPGRLVSKDELIAEVWGGRIVSDAALSSRIKSARRAIGDDGEQQRLIRTVHGRGFRFVGEILDRAQLGAPSETSPTDRAITPRRNLRTVLGRVQRLSTAWIAALAMAVAVGSAVAVTLVRSTANQDTSSTAGAATQARLSVVLLPFGAQGGADTVADALAADVAARLSRWRPVRIGVRALPDTAGQQAIGPASARAFAAPYAARGRLRHDGQTTHIDVELIYTGSDRVLWARGLVYPSADTIEARKRMAAEIARLLGLQILFAENQRSQRERPDTTDPEDLTIRAWALLLRSSHTLEATTQARQMLETALAMQGDSPAALVGLAAVEVSHVINEWPPRDGREARLERADAALKRAVSLAPDDAYAHRVRGRLLRARGEPEQAVAAFQKALELDPYEATVHAELGRVKIDTGRAAEAVQHIDHALQISPHSGGRGSWYFWAGQAALHAGDDEAAVTWLRKAVEDNPNYQNPLPWLAAAYEMLDRRAEARWPLEQFLRVHPDLTVSGFDTAYHRRNPVVQAQRERIAAALRRLGIPN
jgi:DNA-binding winged helix-turn-helix (wHTH) protein/tetratricopeptide (TPR) repeat protein